MYITMLKVLFQKNFTISETPNLAPNRKHSQTQALLTRNNFHLAQQHNSAHDGMQTLQDYHIEISIEPKAIKEHNMSTYYTGKKIR